MTAAIEHDKKLQAWIDPSALMRIKNLQLRAKTVVDGFQSGLHRSPLHGFSVEFSEYRPYTPGDDPRGIDWKLFARTDRHYLKKFEDETNRRCFLVVDQSRSMEYGSLAYSKIEYARTLAATLAYFLSTQRDAVGMVTFESKVTGMVPARFRPGQLKRLLSLLETKTDGTSTDIVGPLKQLADMVHHRSLVIIISDFLVPTEGLQAPLSFLRARRHDVLLLRVLDPSEKELSLEQPTMLRDLETGNEMYIDPHTAKDKYKQRFAQHESQLLEMAGGLGIGMDTLLTNQSLEHALFDLLNAQQSKGGGAARGRSAASAGSKGGQA